MLKAQQKSISSLDKTKGMVIVLEERSDLLHA